MTFSPEFEKALTEIANMGIYEPPLAHGIPLRVKGSPDQTHYIANSFVKCGTIWWATCVSEFEPQGETYRMPCDWLYDPYPILPERGRLTVTGIFLHVFDGGQA